MSDRPFRRYRCTFCSLIYDEADGMPDEGIAPGTRWQDIDGDWYCPQCGAVKADFVPADD